MQLNFKDKSKFLFKTRNFLNKDEESLSAIKSSVEISTFRKDLAKKDLYDDAYVDFSISDCNKTIHLDFGIDSEKEFDNSIYKINTIISTLTNLKDSLIEAKEIIREGEKVREQIDKKSKK